MGREKPENRKGRWDGCCKCEANFGQINDVIFTNQRGKDTGIHAPASKKGITVNSQ
jgi:hypothetical protein